MITGTDLSHVPWFSCVIPALGGVESWVLPLPFLLFFTFQEFFAFEPIMLMFSMLSMLSRVVLDAESLCCRDTESVQAHWVGLGLLYPQQLDF